MILIGRLTNFVILSINIISFTVAQSSPLAIIPILQMLKIKEVYLHLNIRTVQGLKNTRSMDGKSFRINLR